MTLYGLTLEEAKQLLYKHTTGDFARGRNRDLTAKNLIRKGMLTVSKDCKRLIVTPKGKNWCDKHHLSVRDHRILARLHYRPG